MLPPQVAGVDKTAIIMGGGETPQSESASPAPKAKAKAAAVAVLMEAKTPKVPSIRQFQLGQVLLVTDVLRFTCR